MFFRGRKRTEHTVVLVQGRKIVGPKSREKKIEIEPFGYSDRRETRVTDINAENYLTIAAWRCNIIIIIKYNTVYSG